MNFSRHSIQIDETETEYLLSIHASQKERAKSISSYRWDTIRKCWIYPKTARVYDALIEEFGDDLVGGLKINRPGKPLSNRTEDLQVENQDLKEELSEIRKTLELISEKDSNDKNFEAQALQTVLVARENELTEVRHRAKDMERQIGEQRSTIQDYFKELQRLRTANKRLREQLEQKADIQKWLREAAKDATGRNEKFSLIVERLRFGANMPIELVKEIEGELRGILNCDDKNATIHELLALASDAGILSSRGLDFAHIIRKQRNFIAHEVTNEQTLQVRILLCLFAAALLWAEFTE